MTLFLEKVTGYLISTWGSDLADICIVLPNRRAGLFLRKYLSAKMARTIWSPPIFSIEDFVSSVSGLRVLDPVLVMAELYEVHKEVEGKKLQSPEEFMSWAPQLLTDFNEIDRNMVDARQLFSYLDEAKAIALWNPDKRPLTEFENQYLHFYSSLYTYYQKLVSRLLEKKTATSGLLLRTAALNIGRFTQDLSWKHIVFAGFNSLTKAEEQIIRFLHVNEKADLLWDADSFTLEDEQQEAGSFLRHWFRKWDIREPKWIFNDLKEDRKNIEIIGVPNNVGQARVCGEIISELSKSGKLNETTAMVLPDERMLFPVLNSIPSEIRDINVTMGLPLRHTPLAGLLEAVFLMHLNLKKFNLNKPGKTPKFYFRDVLNVLQHPYIKQMAAVLMKENDFAFRESISSLRNANKVFISKEDITTPGKDLFSSDLKFLESVFEPWTCPMTALNCLQDLVEGIRDACLFNKNQETKGSFRLELEYLYLFSIILRQLKLMTESYDFIKSDIALFQLFRQITGSTSIPFYGEPLKGIQLMGMLETRTLDFENLIILSCNEDLLPRSKHSNSFIPFDIKRDFGIPTFWHKDAVYAYHFYRLLQRARKVWLLYNTEPDELGGGDMSRFLRQIINELPACNKEIIITEKILSTPAGIAPELRKISVPKIPAVMKLLETRALKGFSATSLNAYRKCPLSFYLSEIAGIKEPEVPDEIIDAKTLGKAVHLALNNLYKPFLGQRITPENISVMKSGADVALELAFQKVFPGPNLNFGKNLLLTGVAKKIVSRYLKSENKFLVELENENQSMKIIELEKYVENNLEIDYSGKKIPFKLKGIIDRIDLTDNCYRIIDYKTGNVDSKQLVCRTWTELYSEPELDKVFQLLFYSLILFSKKQYRDFPLRAGIISLKKITNGYMQIRLPDGNEQSSEIDIIAIEPFREIINTLITSIFDTGKEFDQTSNPEDCIHCTYFNICGR